MPKMKTNRGAAKRFHRTGTGKVTHKRAFARHILTSKSATRKRRLRQRGTLSKSDVVSIGRLLPYS